MKFKHPLHCWSPFGSVWYCTLAFDTFADAIGAAGFALVAGELSGAAASGLGGGELSGAAPVEAAFFFSHPNSAAGSSRPHPTATAPRSTTLRDGFLACALSSAICLISDSFRSGIDGDGLRLAIA